MRSEKEAVFFHGLTAIASEAMAAFSSMREVRHVRLGGPSASMRPSNTSLCVVRLRGRPERRVNCRRGESRVSQFLGDALSVVVDVDAALVSNSEVVG
jgi:hypothetical protein